MTVLVPLRLLVARAPSGVEVRLCKYLDEADKELSFWRGNLSAVDDQTFWKAKLAAEKPGETNWSRARQILVDHLWTIVEETP